MCLVDCVVFYKKNSWKFFLKKLGYSAETSMSAPEKPIEPLAVFQKSFFRRVYLSMAQLCFCSYFKTFEETIGPVD